MNQKQLQESFQNFHHAGYCVIEDVVPQQECQRLQKEIGLIVDGFDTDEMVSVFSGSDKKKRSDQYFLTSGDTIRCFFEEKAFGSDGQMLKARKECINKVGHALHDLNPQFESFSYSHTISEIVEHLPLKVPQIIQSMYIFKQPRIGGEVRCHQDSTYFLTDPLSVVGLWFALEDATLENGCLWAIPGGHHQPLKEIFKRTEDNLSGYHEELDSSSWDTEQAIPLEVPQGSLIVLHGQLPHFSKDNLSAKSRHAYTLHLVDGSAHYHETNWLQRPNIPIRDFKTVANSLT